MRIRTSVLVAAIGGVLAGAIVGGSALVGASARSGSEPAASATAKNAVATDRPCGSLLDRLPGELREDLEAARALPPGEDRFAALKEIAQGARDGDYGSGVEEFADRRNDHRKELWNRLPAELRDDLRQLRDLPTDERGAAVEELRESALAGEYGTLVQQFAERVQQRRDECRP